MQNYNEVSPTWVRMTITKNIQKSMLKMVWRKGNPVALLVGLQISVQLLSCVQLFVTLWTAAHQASLPITNSQNLLKLKSSIYNLSLFLSLSIIIHLGFLGSSGIKNLPVNAADVGDTGSIPGSGRSPGGGNGNPLQCSCLGNSVDRGAWWATVDGVAKELDTT